MIQNLKTIDQKGIKARIMERLLHPEEYVNKPLIIWRSNFDDGIQERIMEETFDEWNEGKTTEERKWYRKTMLGLNTPQTYNLTEDTIIRDDVDGSRYGTYQFGLLVIDPLFVFGDYNSSPDSLKMYHSIINNRKWDDIEILAGVPVVSFMLYTYDWFQTPDAYPAAEQYVFKPDFVQWAECLILEYNEEYRTLPQSVVDFIRGEGDEAGITYRWYNVFNDSSVGCHFPSKWKRALYNITKEMDEKDIHKIGDLNDNELKSCLPYGTNGMSPDLCEAFVKYIRDHNL